AVPIRQNDEKYLMSRPVHRDCGPLELLPITITVLSITITEDNSVDYSAFVNGFQV
ncbi:hypothetical protein HAX54_037890, partial [Datura stramonium]|nr:hypothetical protein [Datura stramonium]